MNSIIQSVQDPSWWFTTCFMAIIVSILAGYVRDWAEAVLGKVFTSIKKRQARRIARQNMIVKAMLADPMYFQTQMFSTLVSMIAFTICLVFFTLLVSMAKLPIELPQGLEPIDRVFTNIMLVMVGVGIVYTSYQANIMVRIVGRAVRIYRQTKIFPLMRQSKQEKANILKAASSQDELG